MSLLYSKSAKLIAALVSVAMLVGASAAYATAPVKEVLSIHYGWEVDKTTKGNVCTVASGDECQPGKKSGEPGGFENLGDVAVGSAEGEEDIWVDDAPNQRIQEITPAGRFVLTIGDDVNATTGGNICTQAEIEIAHVRCQAGREGGGEGEFDGPASVAVDRATHDLYVLDASNYRIQEFTEAGQFVAMFGKEVNETTKGDVCTEVEVEAGAKCKAGVQVPAGSTEPGVFTFAESAGSQLAFGGPENLLYVADTQRVQEFEPEGKFKREIALPAGSVMDSLAVEESSGDMYLVYHKGIERPSTIHRLGANGVQIADFTLSQRHSRNLGGEEFSVNGVAVDSAGRLAVSEHEGISGPNPVSEPFGSLLNGATGELITEFTVSKENDGGMEFNAKDELYLAISSRDFEVLGYRPVVVAEAVSSPAVCVPGVEGRESDATFDCTLNGEVNPEGVPDTEAWFEWGLTSLLGEVTPVQGLCTTVCGGAPVHVGATVDDLRPDQGVSYRVTAFDEAVGPPEAPLTSQPLTSVLTPLVAPRFVGSPSAEFVKRSSAILFGELNPESASTRYRFQYAPVAECEHLEGCAAALSTPVEESAAYARVGTTAEATGLQPGTAYDYRLVAESENTAKTEHAIVAGEGEQEARFTTVSPIQVQATTGPAGSVGATTALISGSVEPDGQTVSYAFELGVDQGASTQYGVVYSGAVAASATPVAETFAPSGLQPGTSYAYRITVRYGNGLTSGWSATGSPVSFTTQGLPSVLSLPAPLAQLPVPSIVFPAAVTTPKTKTPVKKAKKKKKKPKKTKRKRAKKAKKTSRARQVKK